MADILDIAEELTPVVKVTCRVSGDHFDLEVESAIQAAVADMMRVGIADGCFSEDSQFYPLVRQAVILYCKAYFGQDNPNEEMRFWQTSYMQTVTDLLNSGANMHAQGSTGATGE